MPSLADRIGAARVGPVQESVEGYGQCTYAFTQCKPPVSNFIAQDESTAIGVCESLSAHWIKYHADGGTLWNWLMVDGQVSMTKLLFSVMQLQSLGILGHQDSETESWLKLHGIVRLPRNLPPMIPSGPATSGPHPRNWEAFKGMRVKAVQKGRTRVFGCQELARAILLDNTGGAGCYKKLGLEGRFGAHTMALWVAQDVVFFDPNFGEFWFESRNRFFDWFTTRFWSTSFYNFGLSGTFDILPYAKLVRADAATW